MSTVPMLCDNTDEEMVVVVPTQPSTLLVDNRDKTPYTPCVSCQNETTLYNRLYTTSTFVIPRASPMDYMRAHKWLERITAQQEAGYPDLPLPTNIVFDELSLMAVVNIISALALSGSRRTIIITETSTDAMALYKSIKDMYSLDSRPRQGPIGSLLGPKSIVIPTSETGKTRTIIPPMLQNEIIICATPVDWGMYIAAIPTVDATLQRTRVIRMIYTHVRRPSVSPSGIDESLPCLLNAHYYTVYTNVDRESPLWPTRYEINDNVDNAPFCRLRELRVCFEGTKSLLPMPNEPEIRLYADTPPNCNIRAPSKIVEYCLDNISDLRNSNVRRRLYLGSSRNPKPTYFNKMFTQRPSEWSSCVICLDDFNGTECFTQSCCGNRLCCQCVNNLQKQHDPPCPVCRSQSYVYIHFYATSIVGRVLHAFDNEHKTGLRVVLVDRHSIGASHTSLKQLRHQYREWFFCESLAKLRHFVCNRGPPDVLVIIKSPADISYIMTALGSVRSYNINRTPCLIHAPMYDCTKYMVN